MRTGASQMVPAWGTKMKSSWLSEVARVARIWQPFGYCVALVLSFALIMMASSAEADCTPPAPVNNTIVTCTGSTNPANFNGYGTGTEVGNTYNIVAGATVTGTGNGLAFLSGAVNNSGTISAPTGFFGIVSDSDMTLTNNDRRNFSAGRRGPDKRHRNDRQ
jgi:hypothetical protein